MTGIARLVGLALPLLAGCASLDMFLFNGEPAEGYDFSGSTIPSSLIDEGLFLQTEDGGRVHAVLARQAGPAPTVLYCHGNAANIGRYWDRVEILHGLGARVLIFDYRGYGRSEGEATEENTRADARAARRFLREAGVADEEVFYYGYSIRAAVCLRLATEAPPAGLVLEAPFASVAAIARSASGLDFGPGWLADAVYDNVGTVTDLRAPLLLTHGVDDDFIPVEHGRRVFAAAPEPKRALWVEGADHGDIPEVAAADYDRAVLDVLLGASTGDGP